MRHSSNVVFVALAAGVLAPLTACQRQAAPVTEVIHARFDPEAGVIPMPTNLLRDDEVGRLDLPVDDPDLTDAERALYGWLNTMDGWSSVSQPEIAFTGVIEGASVHSDSVEVWIWDGEQHARADVPVHLATDGTHVVVDPPANGWPHGSTVVVGVHGGSEGVRGARGERVVADAAFYFLRLTEDLTEHPDAFPDEETAEKLEDARRELTPYFDDFASRGTPREELVSLWAFTVTERPELAMDQTTGRMPLPNDLLRDPATGKIDIPVDPDDSELEIHAKKRLAELSGFGTTMPVLFESSAPLDPTTLDESTVTLIDLKEPGLEIPLAIEVSDDLRHVRVQPTGGPLQAAHPYAVLVHEGVKGAHGKPLAPMPVGHFLQSPALLAADGASRVGSLSDEDASRLEWVRTEASAYLDAAGREGLIAAWPFTTRDIASPLLAARRAAEEAGVSPDPMDVSSMTPGEAVLDFPLSALTLFQVEKVYTGYLETPYFLDPLTRDWRSDGEYEVRRIPFTLTIPEDADPSQPLPVVVFGHGLMSERRFVLGVADALASRGYAAIAIDLPFHGERTVCKNTGPLCVPDPIAGDGSLICPDPCKSGSSCAADGRCYDDDTGEQTELSRWPVIPMYQATGAAFVDVDDIAGTHDHFLQAVTDLGALSRSIQEGDWKTAVGYTLDPADMHYMGQSLGGILGGTYTPTDPAIHRAVLNVPGGNVVDMFSDSVFFGAHIDAFRERNDIVEGTPEDWRFFAIAHWFMDGVDPVNVAPYLMNDSMPGVTLPADRDVFIQMALLDIIIPNNSTELLEQVGGIPSRDYVATHTFLTVPLEPEFIRGTADASAFVDGSLEP